MNSAILWLENELAVLKSDLNAVPPTVIAWAKNFLVGITPVIVQAAEDAVKAAKDTPGGGLARAGAAYAAAKDDLESKGIAVVENDLKAVIQIAYNALFPAKVS